MDTLPAVTDSAWTGTGPQIYKAGVYSIDVSEAAAVFSGTEWIILNLRPVEYTGACELYTPFWTNIAADGWWGTNSTSLYPNDEVEFFWNPQRKTYQTAIPAHQGKLSGSGAYVDTYDIGWGFYSALESSMSHAIKWKFQPPTKLYLGTSSGIYAKYDVGGNINDGDATFKCLSDSMFRMPVYDYTDTINLLSYLNTNEWTGTKFPSIEAEALTILRMFVTNQGTLLSSQVIAINQMIAGLQTAPLDKYK